jgi:transposase-like protein
LIEPKYSEDFKRNAIKVYLEGNSGRAVGRILGISKNTIWGWLNEYSQGLPHITESDTDIAEMDELYTHIKKGK